MPSRSARAWPRHPVPNSTSSSCCPQTSRSVITPPDAGYDRYLREQAEDVAGSRPTAQIPDGVTARDARAVRRLVRRGARWPPPRSSAPRTSWSVRPTAACAAGTGSARSPPSCCTPRTCRSCSRPRARVASTRRSASPASRRRSARGRAPTRCSRRRPRSRQSTGAELRLLSLVTVDLPASVDTGVIRVAGAAHADEVLSQARAEPARRRRRRGRRRPRRQHRRRGLAPQLGARRTRDRRLEPPRPAAAAVPRLDRSEDAARTSRSHDRGAAHARPQEGESR